LENSEGFEEGYGPDASEGLRLPPWEQREAYGFLNGLYLTVKGVMLSPGRFFHRMPTRLGLAQPLLFAVVLGVTATFFNWMWTLTGSSLQVLVQESFEEAVRAPIYSFLNFLFSPLSVAVSVLVQAAVVHGVLMIVGGNRLGFEATFRVSAYAWATAILTLVPFCGSVIAVFWFLVVMIIGIYSIHEADPWRAVVAVLAPMLVCLGATGTSLMFLALGLVD
jgi:hypothetical protein